jgi:hypothetical protein
MKLRGYAVFALFTLALAGLTLPASAQNYRGKFTLPFEAHWGAVDLQPGTYAVSTDIVGATPVIFLMGNGTTRSIFSGPVEFREISDAGGRLELAEVNGTHVVTKFVASSVGKEYSFLIPKSISRSEFGAVAMKKVAVPVSN